MEAGGCEVEREARVARGRVGRILAWPFGHFNEERQMKMLRGTIVAVVALSWMEAGASGAMVDKFWVFGDSLSDVGNTYAAAGAPLSPPYSNGRYSNGPVWHEQLADRMGVPRATAS